MSEDAVEVIRANDHGVTIELAAVHEDNDFISLNFGEVRLLENGWVEGREPSDEKGRTNFFPPDRVLNIVVYDQDKDDTVVAFETSQR
jgi:hypothetical protein